MTQQIITAAALILAAGCAAWQLRDLVRLCRMEKRRKSSETALLKIRLCNAETEIQILRREMDRIKREFALDRTITVGKEKKQ